jgi:hypothetical protein
VLQRLEEIKTTVNHDSAEQLDRDITRAMLHAELQCKSFDRLPWSHDLHTAMTILYIFKMQLTQPRTHRNMQSQIDQSKRISLIQFFRLSTSRKLTVPSALPAGNAAKSYKRPKPLGKLEKKNALQPSNWPMPPKTLRSWSISSIVRWKQKTYFDDF